MTTLPRTREDNLPENGQYRDTGCDFHPLGCLVCPLKFCRWDDPGAEHAAMTWERWRRIEHMLDDGATHKVISKTVGCSTRTVARVSQNGLGDSAPQLATLKRYQDNRAALVRLAASSIIRAPAPLPPLLAAGP